MQSELSLFVYGSLVEGMVHFVKIREYILSKAPAFACGTVYRLPSGYPVFSMPTAPSCGDQVPGELVQLQAPELVYKLLDEFHGVSHLVPEKSLYFKQGIEVQLVGGATQSAHVYAINPKKMPKTAYRIPYGDWVSDLRSQPALSQTLTEKQVTYVRRLAKSSGREIVPIDLDLYRELMKLELIVDKGRRLALSPLGKDVARYLL